MDDEVLRQVTRSMDYTLAREKSRGASTGYNYAGAMLERAKIEERNAELGSQAYEHVAKGELRKRLGTITPHEREIGIAFARYAVYGRTD